jgi:hypothetical protein
MDKTELAFNETRAYHAWMITIKIIAKERTQWQQ